ncbi:MAG: hypothetical protein M1830_000784 [Pleopsidium flavum]|nr:MAG: hypothetical protein M1830_000784 [Pleopsidium flavum]
MPAPFTSTFASAAAGNGSQDGISDGKSSTRGDGSVDWSRPRSNGATQTFRRPSLATSISQSQRENNPNHTSNSTPGTGVYVPPHLNSNYQSSLRNGQNSDNRYSKDQLLDMFRRQGESGSLEKNLSSFLVGGWDTSPSNDAVGGLWSRKDDQKEGSSGPDICWDPEGTVQPLGLTEPTDDEKELFSTSINSPLKPPPQNASKENTPVNGIAGRKTSISTSQNSSTAFGISSPTSSRPSNRRRETGESNPLTSPTSGSGSRFFRDDPNTSDPPPSLLRRRTDFLDSNQDAHAELKDRDSTTGDYHLDTSPPFGTFKRSATGPFNTSANGSSSPWSAAPHSAGFPPMGAFGNFSLGGSMGQPPTPGEKRPGFGNLRGESRFKSLMGKDSSEDIASSVKEKSSFGSRGKVPEREHEIHQQRWGQRRSIRPLSSESNPFEGEEKQTGTASGAGSQDHDSHAHHASGLGTAHHPNSRDEVGFSAFGMSSDMPAFRDIMQQHRRDYSQHERSQQHSTPGPNEPMSPTDTNPYQSPEGEKADSEDIDTDGSDIQHANLPGLGALQSQRMEPFGHQLRGTSSAIDMAASDRSQTSSAGPNRGFPVLGGLGGLSNLGGTSGWPAGAGSVGTPSRERPGFSGGFGDSIFGPMGDLQSPTLIGLGSNGFFGSAGVSSGSIARGSKMGSLFPTAMQEQMRGGERVRQEHASGEANSFQQTNPASKISNINTAPGFGVVGRETDSPLRSGRGIFDDLFGTLDDNTQGLRTLGAALSSNDAGASTFTGSLQTPSSTASTLIATPSQGPQSQTSGSAFGQSQGPTVGNIASNQLPTSQQRQMVMPDRMRWIYRDPQGNTQGPWSGLEMHDWYKAGFFSPELQVKKLEDTDYEPLAQLIRRIGNSREPFLVPQIGIPHGSTANGGTTPWTGPGAAPTAHVAGAQPGAAQPPFASSFPSFGTTLTAEQQNALERRKQEEQYLMARQKEHLAQQQVMIKQMQQLQGGPHAMHSQQLHHHSSAHSLQSQPSFGSITSPTAYQASPAQGPIQPPQGVPGFFDAPTRQTPNVGIGPVSHSTDLHGLGREEDFPGLFDRLNLGRGGQLPFGGPSFGASQQEAPNHAQQVTAMMQERARLQREQEQYDAIQPGGLHDHPASNDRLHQFNDLRAQLHDDVLSDPPEGIIGKPVGPLSDMNEDIRKFYESSVPRAVFLSQEQRPQQVGIPALGVGPSTSHMEPEVLSLAEQVQKAASAKQSPAPLLQSPWVKVEANLPRPFPPPQSASPLPAPAAQRNRQHVADALAAESGSRSETPIDTPSASIAPWAKDTAEGSKGPSLKDIQEAEARKAALQEEVAATARRALAEQERLNQPIASAPAPSLPSSSIWGSGTSPVTPASAGPSAWAKPLAGKTPPVPNAASAKKTLAQIQKEEESRKQRAADAAAVNAANTAASGAPGLVAGKRYADLAGKVAGAGTGFQAPGGAWTTVGASGKVKAPVVTASAGPNQAPRAVSGGAVPTIAPPGKSKPAVTTVRSTTMGSPLAGQPNANDEFQKWAKSALTKGLNSNINVDDFVQQLLMLPPEPEIISDSVYANSPTLDGRRFAEEFIRRRKLADKGIINSSVSGSNGFSPNTNLEGKPGGGWSEVAKKGPSNAAKEEPASPFKVVAAKKKGKR